MMILEIDLVLATAVEVLCESESLGLAVRLFRKFIDSQTLSKVAVASSFPS